MAATTNQHQNELTITSLQYKFKSKFRCYPYYISVAIAYVVWQPLKNLAQSNWVPACNLLLLL